MADQDFNANSETDSDSFSHKSWLRKFQVSFRGMWLGIKGGRATSSKNSFVFHIPIAVCVIVAAVLMKFAMVEIAVLLLCIGLVFVAELFNSSIEALSRAVTRDENEEIGLALDVASGAVLAASLAAGLVGALLFVSRLVTLFG